MILRNHGLLAVGRTVPECFLRLYRLERACQVQLAASAAGPLRVLPAALAAKSGADLNAFQGLHPQGEGAIEFEALLRKLDRTRSRRAASGSAGCGRKPPSTVISLPLT